LTVDNLAEQLQDQTPAAHRARAAARMPGSLFGSSTGGSAMSNIAPFGIITRIFSEVSSRIATADPADIQGPADLPDLFTDFVESLPVVGQLFGLLEAVLGTYDGDDNILKAIQNVFHPLRRLAQLIAAKSGDDWPAEDEVAEGWLAKLREDAQVRRMARNRARSGGNFISDSQAQDSDFWTQSGIELSNAKHKSGTQSVKVTRAATDQYLWFNTVDDGTVEPITTRGSESYYVEAWVLDAGTKPTYGTVQLVLWAINSSTEDHIEVVLDSFTAQAGTRNAWRKLSEYYTVPASGYDTFSVGLKLPGNSDAAGDTVHVDDMLCREATDHQANWNRFWDGLNGSTGSTGKRSWDVEIAAGRVRNWALDGHRLSNARLRAGTNLASDPGIDDSGFWTQPYCQQVDSTVVTPHQGNFALQITSAGSAQVNVFFNTDADGAVAPIRTRIGEWFYVETYVFCPDTEPDGTVTLIARLENSRTDAVSDVVITTKNFDTAMKGSWQLIAGYVQVTAGYNQISAGIRLAAGDTTLNSLWFADDLMIRESLSEKAALRALKISRQRAKVGPNFVNDPRAEDIDYWTQPSVIQSDAYKRGGKYSLEVTVTKDADGSSGSTYCWWNTIDDGSIQPISTWLDDVLYVQCFYYAPNQTGTGTVQLVVKASNSLTGAAVETVIKTEAVAEGASWKRISGVYTMPDGVDSFSAGIKLTASGLSGLAPTFKLYTDSHLIREATAAQKIADNIHQALTGDSGTGKTGDDVGVGLKSVFAKLFDGLSNNPEGTSTAKSGFELFAAAKEARERAETGVATAIDATTFAGQILESGSNLIPNSDFESGLVSPQPLVATYSNDQAFSGARSLKMTANGATKTFYLLSSGLTPRTIPVSPGDVFLCEFQVFGLGITQSIADGLRIVIEPVNRLGGSLTDVFVGQTVSSALNDKWTKVSAFVTLPPENTASPLQSVSKMRVAVQLRSTVTSGTFYFDQCCVREVTVAKAAQDNAATAQSTANTASAAASTAQTTANTANSTANTANTTANTATTNIQTVVDGAVQAIDGGSATGAAATTFKTKLQLAWAKIFDGHNGTSGSTSKLPSDIYTAAASVRSTANTADTNANTANTSIQTSTDNIHQAVNGGSSTGNALSTIKANLQLAWAKIFDGHNGTTGNTTKLPSDVYTAAASVRSTANTASTNSSTAITNAATAQTTADTANTSIQTTTDNIHQAINGGTSTGNLLSTVKSNLALAWAKIFDGHNGTTGNTSKLPSDVYTAAASVRSTANTASTNSSTAITNAATAQSTANTANSTANTATTNLQSTVDNIHQAVNGGSSTGNAVTTVKSNLALAWAKFWDGLTGNSGSTSKLPSDVQTAAASVTSTANTASTNASTAITNAGTAQTTANTANTSIQTTTDNIHQAVNGGSGTGNALSTVKSNLALAWAKIWDGHNGTTGTTSKTPADILTAAASVRSTANTASTNASTAITNASTAQSTADAANTSIQTTTDNIHQAVNGGSGTGNLLSTVKSNLQLAWAKIFDGHNGTSGSTSKLPSDVYAAAASVRSTANTASTNASTAITNVSNTNTAIYNGYFGSGGTGTSSEAQSALNDIKTKLTSGWTVQTISANGTWTRPWTTSDAPVDMWAICIGGGSGGGGGYTSRVASGVNFGGSGGAGGGYVAQQINPSDVPSTVTVTIGAGGAGGAGSQNAGAPGAGVSGGATTFGSLATSAGGFTSGAIGSLFGYYDATSSAPGKGGDGRKSDGSVAAQDGGSTPLAAGGTTTTMVGNDGATASLTGQTHAGGGGGAGGRAQSSASAYRTGGNGGFPGGGGGGGGGLPGQVSGTIIAGSGGAGANGVVILLWR
jgi:hypothetical protein